MYVKIWEYYIFSGIRTLKNKCFKISTEHIINLLKYLSLFFFRYKYGCNYYSTVLYSYRKKLEKISLFYIKYKKS